MKTIDDAIDDAQTLEEAVGKRLAITFAMIIQSLLTAVEGPLSVCDIAAIGSDHERPSPP